MEVKKICHLFMLCLFVAFSCKEKVANRHNIDNNSSPNLQDLRGINEIEIDTNVMINQTHRIISVNNNKVEFSFKDYKNLCIPLVDSNVATTLTGKLEMVTHSDSLVKLEYFPLSKHKSTESIKVNRFFMKCLPVEIRNTSKQILNLYYYNDRLRVITEAQTRNGKWKPIEYIVLNKYIYQSGDYNKGEYIGGRIHLRPGHSIWLYTPVFKGSFKTKLRLKLIQDGDTLYSNTYSGSINLDQFNFPENMDPAGDGEHIVMW